MLRTWFIVSTLALLVYGGECEAASGNKFLAKAYYFGFDIQTIVGYPEADIENKGYLYCLEMKKFTMGLKFSQEYLNSYNAMDVRAQIDYQGERYYIDRQGYVRSGSKYFAIDKNYFSNLLRRYKSGVC